MKYPTTPDGRYRVVNGRLQRCPNPALDEIENAGLQRELMLAREALQQARNTEVDLTPLRRRINQTRRKLGLRGRVWWIGDSTDYHRKPVVDTPYANWYAAIPKSGQRPTSNAIRDELLRQAQARYPKTICPSEVARAFSSDESEWRSLMETVREQARLMAAQGSIDVVQRGVVSATAGWYGPVRFRARP